MARRLRALGAGGHACGEEDALLHFIAFLWFDHFFDVAAMLRDVAKRPFILVGFTAFVLLIPLAATSTTTNSSPTGPAATGRGVRKA